MNPNIVEDVTTSTILHTTTLLTLAASFLTGIAILLIYVISNRHKRLDDSLTMVMPLLTVLMSSMMLIDSSIQAVTFFGIFGVLSIVRFRSALTDQKGITFILYAVVMGILVGTQQYLLSLLAYTVIGAMVLVVPVVLPARQFFLATFSFDDEYIARQNRIRAFLRDAGLRFKIVRTKGVAGIKPGGKPKRARVQMEIEIRRPRDTDLLALFAMIQDFAARESMNVDVYEHT